MGRQGLTENAYRLSAGYVPASVSETPLARLYNESPQGQLGIGREFSSGYQSWIQPEVVIRWKGHAQSMPSAGDVTDGTPQSRLSLNDLVEKYMNDRLDAYMAQGWQYFRQADYRQAYERFSLADKITIQDEKSRSTVKMALCYAAIASQQYILALHHLHMLLAVDSRTEQIKDPLFLTRINDLPARYRSPQDFEYHQQMVLAILGRDLTRPNEEQPAEETEKTARNQDEAGGAAFVQARALHAVMLWSKNKNEAKFYADKRLRGALIPVPWSRLPEMIDQALAEENRRKAVPGPTETGTRSGAAASEPAAPAPPEVGRWVPAEVGTVAGSGASR